MKQFFVAFTPKKDPTHRITLSVEPDDGESAILLAHGAAMRLASLNDLPVGEMAIERVAETDEVGEPIEHHPKCKLIAVHPITPK